MSGINNLFSQELKILNIGTSKFKDDLELQGQDVLQLDWVPAAGGDIELLNIIDRLSGREDIKEANKKAVERMMNSHPMLIDIDKAINVIPGMKENIILHSGPPIEWERMAGPMKGAVIGALIYEGRAKNEEEAIKIASSGEIEFSPCNEYCTVGPMAGIVSPSMPVHVVYNKTYGNYGYCTINEGLGKVLRYGAFNDEVIERLKWIEEEFAPTMKKALKSIDGGIDIKSIISQAVHMGDECHNRNKAATSLFFREITSYIIDTDVDIDIKKRVLNFIKMNEHYFLNLSMPSCKVATDAAHGVENSTVVTTMARNGVDFGIRVSGLGEDQWFTAPANMIKGLMFPGFKEEDANPDIGDSAITETMGIGGFAMGGSPAIVQFVGGTVEDAIGYSEKMYEITVGENTNYSIPTLDFRGSAIGIDIVKVIEKGILPIINTGMAHKVAGIGQVGAGLVSPPMECFKKAILEFNKNN
ncbi:DUF1116 domain-containing protein [uncultured Tissierella sp.]|jgi:hypothetical protein|uniref:DUF1116 domain-containing protein n=1 Tax=uncultured Tissierella sp. TaxID=448160 RepID=UPI0028042FF5|nr:DUF1116 domain-containing protein [uncultured Tissierella sp.]MDU5082690.1 DUF1116 domain-containing protein [Bacillota bacterium]